MKNTPGLCEVTKSKQCDFTVDCCPCLPCLHTEVFSNSIQTNIWKFNTASVHLLHSCVKSYSNRILDSFNKNVLFITKNKNHSKLRGVGRSFESFLFYTGKVMHNTSQYPPLSDSNSDSKTGDELDLWFRAYRWGDIKSIHTFLVFTSQCLQRLENKMRMDCRN